MIVTKMSLPRRTFLRGVGATLAIPLLDAMVPAFTPTAKSAAAPVRRLGFVYSGNGYLRDHWVPKAVGSSFEFTPALQALAPYRDRLLIVSGLANLQAEAMGDATGPHSRASAAWLTGAHAKQTEGADVRAGTSADQIAAAALGTETPLSSLEITTDQNERAVGNCEFGYSCVYQNTISWRNPTTPIPLEAHPRVVFQRLFGDGGTPAEQRNQRRTSRSILDSITDRIGELQKRLGPTDRGRLAQYLDSVRDVESRIQRTETKTGDPSLQLPDRPVDIPADFDEYVKLMFDLQILAYQADITRVTTFQLCREFSPRSYPNLGISGGHHTISHHGQKPENLAQKAKIDAYHIQLFSYYAEKLRTTPDGEGSLLDHVIVLYGTGLGEPNQHAVHDQASLILGGGAGAIKGGRHVAFPVGDFVPLANLLVTLLDKAGVPIQQHGDSTGRLETLSGV